VVFVPKTTVTGVPPEADKYPLCVLEGAEVGVVGMVKYELQVITLLVLVPNVTLFEMDVVGEEKEILVNVETKVAREVENPDNVV
jgi:hypothetical protein